MPLSERAKNSLEYGQKPTINYATQGRSDTVATDDDIPEIIALLNKNLTGTMLTIHGQNITDPDGKLINSIIKHASIQRVDFYSNSKFVTRHRAHDSYDQKVSGPGKEMMDWLNKLLADKQRLIQYKSDIGNFLSQHNESTLETLTEVYHKLNNMREIQKNHPKLDDQTSEITNTCLETIFRSIKSLLIKIFSNPDNFKEIKEEFPDQINGYRGKIEKDETFPAMKASVEGFIKSHAGFFSFTSPDIVKQLHPYHAFLTLIAPEKMLTSTANNYGRFNYNIPTNDSSLNNDNAAQFQTNS